MDPSGTIHVSVRAPASSDADDLAATHVLAWQAAYAGLMPREYLAGLDVAARAEAWRTRLATSRGGVLVADVGGRADGFVVFGTARDAGAAGLGEVFALNVRPERWGTTTGAELLAAAHDGLRRLGHHDAVLWVLPGNARAQRFYEKHGWSARGDRRTRDVQGVHVEEVNYCRSL